MKAVALTGPQRLEVIDVPSPKLSSDKDVLLKIERVGVCGSDLHYFEHGRIGSRVVRPPFIPGHECSGIVVEIGAAVTRVKQGQRVAVDPAMSCGQCDQCLSGRPHTCRNLRFLGCPGESDGALCEWLVMPEACLYPADERLSADQVALCEPLSIGMYAVRLSQLTAGASVLILGSGPIGLCVYCAARSAGAGEVCMTDLVEERIQFAKKMGADWSGNAAKQDMVALLRQRRPEGFDVAFECAGKQSTLDEAVELLKPGGKIVIVGIPREDRVSFPIDLLRRKELAIINVRRQNHCVRPALDAVASGSVPVERLATHWFPPEGAQAAFEMVRDYRDGVIKAMIVFA